MYEFVTHTWNTIKGACPHDCSYCYMKRWGKQNPDRFDEKELKTDLGNGNFIFVGSSCDMFADDIPETWILRTLEHCFKYNNRYLFQTKNPKNAETLITLFGKYPKKPPFKSLFFQKRTKNQQRSFLFPPKKKKRKTAGGGKR